MADDGASSQIPPTLTRAAGITWRVLILLAGLVVVGYFLNLIFPVALALFLSLLVTALASPVMNLLGRFMPRVLAMVLAVAGSPRGGIVTANATTTANVSRSKQ